MNRLTDKKKQVLPGEERQVRLLEELRKNLLLSDEQLAERLDVSIHTVRSDRRKAGIPEVRRRGGGFADSLVPQVRTLSEHEIVGEVLDVELGVGGISILETTPEMGLKKSGIVRGHILFAQANSLANAVIDADVSLTGEAHIRYLYPLFAGERVTAKARVIQSGRRRQQVDVILKTKERVVFEGSFFTYKMNQKLASYFRERQKRGQKGKTT
jgi:acyl-coenzyme A thioesterase PaaI-like protein